MGEQLDARHHRKDISPPVARYQKKKPNVVFKQGLIKTWQAYGIEWDKQMQFEKENNV